MKKIMFNNHYGLTDAVVSGRKTMTRRIITCPKTFKGEWVAGFHVYKRQSDGAILECPSLYDADESTIDGAYILPKYKVGEVVALAQSYKDAGVLFIPEEDDEFGCYDFPAEQTNGWTNKMFVRADLMPHQIQFKGWKVERLQDISWDDCLKEGIYADEDPMNPQAEAFTFPNAPQWWFSPKEAYAALIDKVSGKGVWESNPYVFAYDFELVK